MIRYFLNCIKTLLSWVLLGAFYIQMLFPFGVSGMAAFVPVYTGHVCDIYNSALPGEYNGHTYMKKNDESPLTRNKIKGTQNAIHNRMTEPGSRAGRMADNGPATPEATSFKAVGADKLVNLFTGDFSYSIPLLDVGGYPVNLFYNGGITMEQEASWVGLGWNINPGSVTRNMRGIPDDFDGTDTLVQQQNVKPNRTWGGEIGVDGEIFGIKKPKVNFSLGFSYNNYLGPELSLGAGASIPFASIETFKSEKSAPDTLMGKVNLNAKLSSRSGLTFSPSLNANLKLVDNKINTGIGLSTSYNSRSGIRNLNVYSEMSYYTSKASMDDKGILHLRASQGGIPLASSTISFARPSYMPVLRMPMQNTNFSGQLELGAGLFGLRGAGTAMGFYTESGIAKESQIAYKPLVGYIYLENAVNNKNAVMDFNRLNDREVTPNTPVISAPQYTYDVFTIQGEGTGGTIRAYRGDMGFVRDNETTSKDKNNSIGVDIAPPGHYGGNWNSISTPTRVGGWEDGNNMLKHAITFEKPALNSDFENVYFKNPGESTVNNQDELDRVGRDNLVRFKLTGSKTNVRVEPKLEQFAKNSLDDLGVLSLLGKNKLQQRSKRSQVISMLTAGDASDIGLEKGIRNYTGSFDLNNNITYQSIPRVGAYRKKNHISEIDVTEQNGMRYVYGIPVYNTIQKDFTFSVDELQNTSSNLVNYASDEIGTESHNLSKNSALDGYVQIQQTPAYASSFLLTGLLSPDYVDVTGDGITEDDIGNAVKFNYSKSESLTKWRTPRNESAARSAHFNEGAKTEVKDNKATISYGERESWYLSSIESKSFVAIFKTDSRHDAKGVIGESDGRRATENVNKKLTRIDLYTKSEIKSKGIDNAVPIKSVYFQYDYSLCKGVPGNDSASAGKLSLKSIYFTYNGQSRQSKDKYVFGYNESSSQDNPAYGYLAADKWGTYKSPSGNPAGLSNIDFPYSDTSKSNSDNYAGAWSLKKILLPSGGQINVDYEADDYAYVQNKRACNMFGIKGLGDSKNYSMNNTLYNGTNVPDNFYVYIHLPKPLENTGATAIKNEIATKYLDGMGQLCFRLMIEMPKGPEYLTVYAEYDDYGVCGNSPNKDYIYIHLKSLDGKSPLATSAIGFLTDNLPGQAFPGYDVTVDDLSDFLNLAGNMLSKLKEAFTNVDDQMRQAHKARLILPDRSFVRLDNPERIKYGGGVRVKRITYKDNWNKMTGQYDSEYGQDYQYTTTQKIGGKEVNISSGVASYEPGIGSEENPFRGALLVKNKLPAASARYGAIETPVLESLFPSPYIGYSKVTIRSIHRNSLHSDSVLRSAVGKQVTEFYTAKDFPVIFSYTPLKSIDYHKDPLLTFFNKQIIDRRTVSQGFMVETNDMHGKMKSQAAYSESDEQTPLTASYYSYRNTGTNGFNDKVNFVYKDSGLIVKQQNMGIDVEMMNDVREFSVNSSGSNLQAQVDVFPVIFPFTIPTAYVLQTNIENLYRAVTSTKLINYHAILDTTIMVDKGSSVKTLTTAYDAETGSPLVSMTYNEFQDPVYSVSYPAWWAYSGMAPAYRNIDRQFDNVNFYDGKITTGADTTIFESGDELYFVSPGTSGTGDCGTLISSGVLKKIWVFDKNKNNSSLTDHNKDLLYMEANGKMVTRNNVSIRIIRSGKKNLLGATVSNISLLKNPIQLVSSQKKLIIDSSSKVINATATEFKEKWATDCDTYQSIRNPYINSILGDFKPYKSYVYYEERNETDPGISSRIRKDGTYKNFKNFWALNIGNDLAPNYDSKWVWNGELMKLNALGQEIESKDALNKYVSTQYGFLRNLPVSEIQNASDDESLSEGFEDYYFGSSINNKSLCFQRKIDFSSGAVRGGAGINPFGLSYTVADNHDGTQTLSVNSASFPPGTNTVILTYFNGTNWVSGTPGGPVSPKTSQFPVGNWKYRINYYGTNPGFIDLNPLNDMVNVMPHSGSGMLKVLKDSSITVPMYINSQTDSYKYNSDSIQFKFGKDSIISTFYSGVNPGVNVSGSPVPSPFGGGVFGASIARIYSGGSGTWSNTLEGYFIPTISEAGWRNITWVCQGNQYIQGSCGVPSVHVAGGSITIQDINGNNIASGGTGGGTVNSQYLVSASGYSYQAGHVYKITASFTEYGSVPSCSGGPNYVDVSCFVSLTNVSGNPFNSYKSYVLNTETLCSNYTKPMDVSLYSKNPSFGLKEGKRMILSAWVKDDCSTPCFTENYHNSKIQIEFPNSNIETITMLPKGNIIEGWQKIEGEFTVPTDFSYYMVNLKFVNDGLDSSIYFDDLRIHPFNAQMKSFSYDPQTLQLSAVSDENNYATFYNYDEEGQLIRVKKETERGIETIQETRNSKQKTVTDFQ